MQAISSAAQSVRRLARQQASSLGAYNAGLSSEAVRNSYGVTEIARLASNENPLGASPLVQQALTGIAPQLAAPSSANFPFFACGYPSVQIAEALLAHGIIVKPWRETGHQRFIRVSNGSAADNRRFLHALPQVLAKAVR